MSAHLHPKQTNKISQMALTREEAAAYRNPNRISITFLPRRKTTMMINNQVEMSEQQLTPEKINKQMSIEIKNRQKDSKRVDTFSVSDVEYYGSSPNGSRYSWLSHNI